MGGNAATNARSLHPHGSRITAPTTVMATTPAEKDKFASCVLVVRT